MAGINRVRCKFCTIDKYPFAKNIVYMDLDLNFIPDRGIDRNLIRYTCPKCGKDKYCKGVISEKNRICQRSESKDLYGSGDNAGSGGDRGSNQLCMQGSLFSL